MKDRKQERLIVNVRPDEIDTRFLYHRPTDPNVDQENNTSPHVSSSTPYVISPFQSPVYAPESPDSRSRRDFLRACLAIVSGCAVVVAERTGILNLIPDDLEGSTQVSLSIPPVGETEGSNQNELQIDPDVIKQFIPNANIIVPDEILKEYPPIREMTRVWLVEAVERLGYGPNRLFRVVYEQSSGRGGITYGALSDESGSFLGQATVYVPAGDPVEHWDHYAKHEIIHVINTQTTGNRLVPRWDEGFATWGTGNQWAGKSFREHAGDLRRNYGYNEPLSRSPQNAPYQSSGQNELDLQYVQWASFIEFVIEQKGGREKAVKLLDVENTLESIYGEAEADLESQWLEWLNT
jgi:hypothetical protein